MEVLEARRVSGTEAAAGINVSDESMVRIANEKIVEDIEFCAAKKYITESRHVTEIKFTKLNSLIRPLEEPSTPKDV